jgi:hypothetical protein
MMVKSEMTTWTLDAVVEIDERGRATEYPIENMPDARLRRLIGSDQWHRMSRREREQALLMVRPDGIEPPTSTVSGSRSTTELRTRKEFGAPLCWEC